MLNRRKLIESALAMTVVGTTSTVFASKSVTHKPWTADYFQQRIGQRFRLTGPGTGVAKLIAVDRCPSDACTESFHLCFEVECDNPVEGIYQLSQSLRRDTSLFMQPRGQHDCRTIFGASVARLLG